MSVLVQERVWGQFLSKVGLVLQRRLPSLTKVRFFPYTKFRSHRKRVSSSNTGGPRYKGASNNNRTPRLTIFPFRRHRFRPQNKGKNTMTSKESTKQRIELPTRRTYPTERHTIPTSTRTPRFRETGIHFKEDTFRLTPVDSKVPTKKIRRAIHRTLLVKWGGRPFQVHVRPSCEVRTKEGPRFDRYPIIKDLLHGLKRGAMEFVRHRGRTIRNGNDVGH